MSVELGNCVLRTLFADGVVQGRQWSKGPATASLRFAAASRQGDDSAAAWEARSRLPKRCPVCGCVCVYVKSGHWIKLPYAQERRHLTYAKGLSNSISYILGFLSRLGLPKITKYCAEWGQRIRPSGGTINTRRTNSNRLKNRVGAVAPTTYNVRPPLYNSTDRCCP